MTGDPPGTPQPATPTLYKGAKIAFDGVLLEVLRVKDVKEGQRALVTLAEQAPGVPKRYLSILFGAEGILDYSPFPLQVVPELPEPTEDAP